MTSGASTSLITSTSTEGYSRSGVTTFFTSDWMPDDTGWQTYLMRASDPHFAGVFDTEVEKDVQLEIDEAVSNPKIGQTHALLPSLHRLVHVVDTLAPDFLKFLE